MPANMALILSLWLMHPFAIVCFNGVGSQGVRSIVLGRYQKRVKKKVEFHSIGIVKLVKTGIYLRHE
jgi:hypothetical protein